MESPQSVQKSFLVQRFAKLNFGSFHLIGYSVAGEETVIQVPEWNVCFDFGRAPHFALTSDIVCLSCHDKNGGFGTWANSAHARPDVADETYRDASAQLREFPSGLPVWKAACLNCHDTHTVPGAQRIADHLHLARIQRVAHEGGGMTVG